MQRRGPGCKYPGSFRTRGRFLLWFSVEVVSRPLRPQIILAQAAGELFGDGLYLPVGRLPRRSLGGESDVDFPSADLTRSNQQGERRI
jgi:hypothetical protein